MNKIVIELSAEDRARIDRLTVALENAAVGTLIEVEETAPPEPEKPTAAKPEPVAVVTEPNNWYPGGSPEPEEVVPEIVEPEVFDGPAITLEQIQQKVVSICAADGAKKADVKAIINKYGTKVSDLKNQQDKWPEVWKALLALESEG